MSLRIGDIAPNFTVATTAGEIDFHDWIGESWCFFFSHPADFTPVCTTEMGRTVFIIGPDKKIRLTMTYPMSVGRNFDEILRVIDALQASDENGIATPADWKVGDKVIIPPSVSNEEAAKQFPQGFDEIKPYLRYTTIG